METYHKIQTLFKRHLEGPKKGKMIRGDWTTQTLEYLADNEWEFTEKVDGTNIRIRLFISGPKGEEILSVEYAGRTDNAVIPKGLLRVLEEWFPTYPRWRSDLSQPRYDERYQELLDWMLSNGLEEVILFGEGYGDKIQSGGKYMEAARKVAPDSVHTGFVLFDVKIDDFWLLRKDVDDIAAKLGIESVPTIGHGTLNDAIDIVSSGITFTETGAVKRWGSGGLQSTWGPFEAEGIVARPLVPLFDRKGQRIITKIKAVDFR